VTQSLPNAESIKAKVGPLLAAWIDSHHYGSGHEFDRHFFRSLDPAHPACRLMLQSKHHCHRLRPPDSLKTAAQAAPKRRRKPSIAAMVKRAEKAGKIVTSVSVEGDKVILTFGESNPTDANNPWLAEIEKATKR